MASLLAPAAPGSERISQILPTVKCSDCNEPVPLSQLGSHVCAPNPPVPKLPLQSPRSVADYLPNKLRELVNLPAQLQVPPRTTSINPSPARQRSPAPAPSLHASNRSRALSSASSLSSRSGSGDASRPTYASPLARDPRGNNKVPFPAHPPELLRTSSPAIPPRSRLSPGPGPETAHTPRNVTQPATTTLRPRAPSSASLRPNGIHESSVRHPTMSSPSPSPYVGPRLDSRAGPAMGMAPPDTRHRAGTSASVRPSFDRSPDIIYSTDMRSRTPVANPVGMRAPSVASMRAPSVASMRAPSVASMRAPSVASMRAPSVASMRAPSVASVRPMGQMRPSMDQMRRPSGEQQRMGGPTSRTPPISTPPLGTPPAEPDTKSGGSAGMAGVGRRGFAAAARAAMFAHAMGSSPMSPTPDPFARGQMAPQGMDGRRANAPRYLDIASATRYATNTPPLSPGSDTASMSPHTPFSQQSPGLPGLPSPSSRMSPSLTPTAPAAAIASSSPTSPTSVHNLRDRVMSPPQEVPKVTAAEPQTPRLPFFEKFKNKLPNVNTVKAAEVTEPSPLSAGSDDSYGGLAYADSDEDDIGIPLRSSPQPIATPAKAEPPKTAPATAGGKVRFPSMTESKYSSSSSRSSTDSPRLPQRSLSATTGSSSSSSSSRTVAKSTGALDRAMETLFEEGMTSPTVSTASRTLADTTQRDSVTKSPKLPMRSHTSPTLPSGRHDQRSRGASSSSTSSSTSRRPKMKVCVRCESVIENGRWIQMEGGNVLCDRCWKNMYLPKCRRCNKTIEKQAVSSSDGQLKGKWHRDCFSCFTCQKPFPDKSFYVYDGKPYCAYHYHEENNSLCAAARCGQPIEGPCAVSHAGDRYHPEHFLCEYRGCTERLVEYYELNGRMLCETHVRRARDENDEEDDYRDAMAMKRVTRFIDLAAFSGVS